MVGSLSRKLYNETLFDVILRDSRDNRKCRKWDPVSSYSHFHSRCFNYYFVFVFWRMKIFLGHLIHFVGILLQVHKLFVTSLLTNQGGHCLIRV